MAQDHHHHDHPHEPLASIQPLVPEPVLRLIALGETVSRTGVTVVEDSRLKADELNSQGVTKGLSYFDKRLMTMKAVLADKKVASEDEFQDELKRVRQASKEPADAPPPLALRVEALTNLLIRKGIVTREALDLRYEAVRARTPMTGGKIVARAWTDPDFKARLKQDPVAAVMSLDPNLLAPNNGEGEAIDTWNLTRLEVLENSDKIRNVVVCTLCSCYPRGLLGEPPEWYTSDSYRERIVREPRTVLKEMGLSLGEDVEIRVYDSSADIRYLVIPQRPRGTEGLSEEALAKLVTRDSLIGAADPQPPAKS
jgi:nitrile hydratase